jgi:hypothetical protein
MAASKNLTPQQRVLRARLGAHTLHARGLTNTATARKTWEQRFVDEVDPDRVLPHKERAKRAEAAKKAHMTALAFKSSVARTKKKRGSGS